MSTLNERLERGRLTGARRALLGALAITQRDVARIIGVTGCLVTQTFSAGANLRPDTAEALGELAKQRVIELFTAPGGGSPR